MILRLLILQSDRKNIKVKVLRDKGVQGESLKVFRKYLFLVDNKFKAKGLQGCR